MDGRPWQEKLFSPEKMEGILRYRQRRQEVAAHLGWEVEGVIRTLSPRQLEIFQLIFFDRLTHQAVADKLGITKGSVTSQYQAAKNKIRKELRRCNPSPFTDEK